MSLLHIIVIGFSIVSLLIVYSAMVVSGRCSDYEDGIHRFDNVTIGDCEEIYNKNELITTIENGKVTGFEVERER